MDIPQKNPKQNTRQKIARFFFAFPIGNLTNLHELGVFQKISSLTLKNIVKLNGSLDQKRYYI